MLRVIPMPIHAVRLLSLLLLLLSVNGCAIYDYGVERFATKEYSFPCFDEPCRVFNALALQGNGEIQAGWFRLPGGEVVGHARGFDPTGKMVDITCPGCVLETEFLRVHVTGYRIVGVKKNGNSLNEAFLDSMMPVYWQRMFDLQKSDLGKPTSWEFLYRYFEARADEAVKDMKRSGLYGESLLAPKALDERMLCWLRYEGVTLAGKGAISF